MPARCFRIRAQARRRPEPRGDGGHVGAGFPTCTMASGIDHVPQVEKPAATGASQARAARNAPPATAAPCGVASTRRCRFSYLHYGIGYQACSAGRKTCGYGDSRSCSAGRKTCGYGDSRARVARNAPTATAATGASPRPVGAGFPTCTMASGTKHVPQVEKPAATGTAKHAPHATHPRRRRLRGRRPDT